MPAPDLNSFAEIVSTSNILMTLVALIAIWLFARGAAFVMRRLADRSATRRLLLLRLIPVARLTIYFLGTYLTIVIIYQPSANSVFALTASAAVAIGFAAQDILKNIFGGIVVILDQPFQVGDKVEVGNYYGEVVNIGLRSVKLVTNDDSLVTVPNAQIVNQAVANGNAGKLDFQVVPELLLPPDADVDLVKRLAWEAAATSPYVYLDKPISVRLSDEFRDRLLLKVRIKAYVLDTRLEMLFHSDVTERAKRAFIEHGLLSQIDKA